MEIYINETEAKNKLKELIQDHTNDYKLFVRKREIPSPAVKEVEFAVVVKEEDGEDVFNSLANLGLDEPNSFVSISSGIMLDEAQRVLKDMILVRLKVKI